MSAEVADGGRLGRFAPLGVAIVVVAGASTTTNAVPCNAGEPTMDHDALPAQASSRA